MAGALPVSRCQGSVQSGAENQLVHAAGGAQAARRPVWVGISDGVEQWDDLEEPLPGSDMIVAHHPNPCQTKDKRHLTLVIPLKETTLHTRVTGCQKREWSNGDQNGLAA